MGDPFRLAKWMRVVLVHVSPKLHKLYFLTTQGWSQDFHLEGQGLFGWGEGNQDFFSTEPLPLTSPMGVLKHWGGQLPPCSYVAPSLPLHRANGVSRCIKTPRGGAHTFFFAWGPPPCVLIHVDTPLAQCRGYGSQTMALEFLKFLNK